ncbi:MAG: citrate lyase acyl carrier protein [Clostridia bacterium]|nr:citrate lyase acyl carrier protein [Clostridia bacterium]
MEIKKPAVAGTVESSDCMVTVEPGEGKVELNLESAVIRQYGKQIRKVIHETLDRLEVTDAKVTVVDKGALDCTIKARVECAVYRSNDIKGGLPWGGVIK